MIKLLISVKNVEEALIAMGAGVDMIDLKDPIVGALGALDLNLSQKILQKIKQIQVLSSSQSQPLVSATVGENHTNASELVQSVDVRIKAGVGIIKIAVSDLYAQDALTMLAEQAKQVKLVAVFFAEQPLDLALLKQLKDIGFYGAMIDTQKKQHNLLEICSLTTLQKFIQKCREYDLQAGLAGSLKPQHLEYLVDINPSYIGFRGGVCADNVRGGIIIGEKINYLQKLLRQHNKFNDLAQFEPCLALHS